MKNLAIPPPPKEAAKEAPDSAPESKVGDSISRSVFWAQMRCWGLCLLVLTVWGGIGIAALWSPLLFGDALPLWADASLPTYWLPLTLAAMVLLSCRNDWKARIAHNAVAIDYWERNLYAFEPHGDHPDQFSCELESLSATLSLGTPRWFVTLRKGLYIRVYTPASSAQRAAILITSDMFTAGFSVIERRALLAHELAHVRLRGYLFDMLCASVNIVAWLGVAVAALIMHAYLGWHVLLLVLVVPFACWLASFLGDMVAALISRIHEGSADRIADIVVGPGSVAKCLVHLLRAQINRAPKGERVYVDRRLKSGIFARLRYIRGELLAAHPHELARIAASRKARAGRNKFGKVKFGQLK